LAKQVTGDMFRDVRGIGRRSPDHANRVMSAHPIASHGWAMHTILWILQVLLAALFIVTGTVKLTQPRRKMAAGPMKWAAHVTDAQFRAIGLVEILGALGLVVPAALGVATFLTPLAAVGLALTMVAAGMTHLRLGELDRIAVPLFVLALTVFVAIERFGPQSF
jgi:uncharacterized membrane protein YphA (DoxX/SURF4 family)